MIALRNYKSLIGSTLTVMRTGTKREPYTVTGELVTVSAHRIILADVKSGRSRRIPLERVLSIVEIEPEIKILNFLLDGSGAALSLDTEVNENGKQKI